MPYTVPKSFGLHWRETPQIWFDFESTDLPPHGRAVEVGLARFENGVCVQHLSRFINPGIPIPAEATAIHGITDAMVVEAPSVVEVFEDAEVREACEGAQPAAYNHSFDRLFLPVNAPIDHAWPMLDALVVARHVDRYERGAGKHKLTATCERHGVVIANAHRAGDDAKAAGEVFHVLVPKLRSSWLQDATLGKMLHWMREEHNAEWLRFHEYLYAKQQQEQQP